jgi:hypothetical protein
VLKEDNMFIIQFIPLILIACYHLLVKSKGGFSVYVKKLNEKKYGITCYACSDPLLFEHEYPSCCTICQRNSNLKKVISPISSRFDKLKIFVLYKEFDKLLNIILILSLVCVVLDLTFFIFKINTFNTLNLANIPSTIFLSLYWILMMFKVSIVTK